MDSHPPRYICIHGHFYQPPRENPWLGEIETQPGAAPYPDWNARITAECYGPNTAARIVTNDNRILDIRNNFERISFNFGPTLLSWMEKHSPEVYERILQADRTSAAHHRGHGNALAQAYNHIIMPLADRRDKQTQILWGLEDFRRRFRRDPEGMWLPETAADVETLELLAANGIRFALLAPHQARRFRGPETEKVWKECNGSCLDPTRVYGCSLPGGRSIALFFYDGPISRSVAFEGLLSDGVRFAKRLIEAFRPDRSWPQLVHIAGDGETYGHHHRYGEMALAYALYYLKSRGAAMLTNYGNYLSLHPPEAEAELLENTSWSCMHGIERWRSDCGCASHPRPGWNQKWRGPLREALNHLKHLLDDLFEKQTQGILKDPWKARDEYIEVVADRSGDHPREFVLRHAPGPLSDPVITDMLRLLEMQHNAMLMFTSCGWFFDELSGIETVQNLQYASRAIQLASQFRPGMDREFLRLLGRAPSNVLRDGREVWERLVKPSVVDLNRVIAHYAISHLYEPAEGRARVFNYEIEVRGTVQESFGQTALGISQVRAYSLVDRSSSECVTAVLHFGGHDFHCSLRGPLDPAGYEHLREDLLETFRRRSLTEVVRTLDHRFESRYFTLQDLFAEERRRLLGRVTREAFSRFQSVIDLIYDENRKLMEYVQELGAPLPRGFVAAAEQVLSFRMERAIKRYLEAGNGEQVADLARESKHWGVSLATPRITQRLQKALHQLVLRMRESPGDLLYKELMNLLDVVDSAGIEIDLWEAQNACFQLIYPPPPAPETVPLSRSVSEDLKALAQRLRIVLDSPLRHPGGTHGLGGPAAPPTAAIAAAESPPRTP
jgi:alpha-amylase/alpha-mannosidase (GH57 family)